MARLSWGISMPACPSHRGEHQKPGSLSSTREKPLTQQGLWEVRAFIKGRTDPGTCDLPLQDSRKLTLLHHLPFFQPFIPL